MRLKNSILIVIASVIGIGFAGFGFIAAAHADTGALTDAQHKAFQAAVATEFNWEFQDLVAEKRSPQVDEDFFGPRYVAGGPADTGGGGHPVAPPLSQAIARAE